MSRLVISLLGAAQLSLDGVPLKVPTLRAVPLLAYLALAGSPQSRETLANLLWSDSDLTHALASLRTTLWRLKSSGLEEWISIDSDEVSLNNPKNIDVDVLEFKAKIGRCANHGHPASQICLYCLPSLTEAIDLYRGEFMAGFDLSKARGFDDWRLQEGEALQVLFIDALERLVRGHRTFGDFNLAIQFARTLLSHDRFNDTAEYNLLQLYSITGQRTTAIKQYKRYKEFLSHELGIQPSEELTNLYKHILSGPLASHGAYKVNTPVFMLADIDNAASLWAMDGIVKNEFLFTYHNIFMETSRQFGGYLIQKSDDNLIVLFESGQPLHCAATIHLKLKKANWGVNDPPHVRMVLYSTFLENANNNSSSITRLATNLLSVSWGGQVLFPEHTLRDLEPLPGSKIKDLGFHSITDIREPVHIFELYHPHLPIREHKPLKSGAPLLVNFPRLTSSFIGRENELQELSELFKESDKRLISLVGPGGIGKTRLATQFASQVAGSFSDGVYFISLAHIQDPHLIPILLADTLKFDFYGPKNHSEQLVNYLHRKNILLVFDNFEHLLAEGCDFLAFLLNNTHFLKILVTSRSRLNLLAETIMEVHGLPVPASGQEKNAENYSSVKLFLYNAHQISPRFNNENNRSAIIRICQLVDGMPLGIILASSWVRVFSCEEIAGEINQNIDFLTTSIPDLPARHRSLRAVFDQSWGLLSREEQLILCRLSIFRSTFTTQAGQEICAATPEILSTFLDKSLLQVNNNRYELLATFSQYSLSKLEEIHGEFQSTQRKFIDYYVNFCVQKNEEFSSAVQRQALDEMISEFENIRIAWNWMIELNLWDLVIMMKQPLLTYHVMIGHVIQGREFFRLAVNKVRDLNDPGLAHVHASLQQVEAWMLVKNGFINEGIQILLRCLEKFQQVNSAWDIITTLMFLADAHRLQGNPAQGANYIDQALQLTGKINLPKENYTIAILAHCQSIQGQILIDLGKFDEAESILQAALAVHQSLGTFYGMIPSLLGLGKLAYLRGEFIHSKLLYLQALETATRIFERRGMAIIQNNLGAICENTASPIESHQHTLTALKLSKETGDQHLTALILNNRAYHQSRYLHHPAEAIRTYHESIEIFSEIGDMRGLTYSYYDITKAYLQVGLREEAYHYCSQSLQSAITLDSTPLILHALHGFAYLFSCIGEYDRSLRLCHQLEKHPQIELDTKKRVIVTRLELEARLSPQSVLSARQWGEFTDLQDIIDQVLTENLPLL